MRFLLLGKGKTTISIAKFLKEMKQDFFFATNINEKQVNDLLLDEKLLTLDVDYVIKSPGISQNNSLFIKIKKKFHVISELDLFALFQINIKMIAITGTNGKTTCVHMIHEMLKKAHYQSLVCGNSHQPIFDYYLKFSQLDYLIVELSSFQLEDLKMYHPHISAILNLEENHLDSVQSKKKYFMDKTNIFKHCSPLDYFIYNPEIKFLKRKHIKANIRYFNPTIFYKFDFLDNVKKYKEQIMILYEIKQILNIDSRTFLDSINQFQSLPYRQQAFWVEDTLFVNDSKSTSIAATVFAFEQLNQQRNILLIIGGKDKNLNYKKLKKLPAYRLIVYGEIKEKVSKKIKSCIAFDDLEKAFKYATTLNIKQKTILFSPSTSSFDQYENYVSRGNHFNELIARYQYEIQETKG